MSSDIEIAKLIDLVKQYQSNENWADNKNQNRILDEISEKYKSVKQYANRSDASNALQILTKSLASVIEPINAEKSPVSDEPPKTPNEEPLHQPQSTSIHETKPEKDLFANSHLEASSNDIKSISKIDFIFIRELLLNLSELDNQNKLDAMYNEFKLQLEDNALEFAQFEKITEQILTEFEEFKSSKQDISKKPTINFSQQYLSRLVKNGCPIKMGRLNEIVRIIEENNDSQNCSHYVLIGNENWLKTTMFSLANNQIEFSVDNNNQSILIARIRKNENTISYVVGLPIDYFFENNFNKKMLSCFSDAIFHFNNNEKSSEIISLLPYYLTHFKYQNLHIEKENNTDIESNISLLKQIMDAATSSDSSESVPNWLQ